MIARFIVIISLRGSVLFQICGKKMVPQETLAPTVEQVGVGGLTVIVMYYGEDVELALYSSL